MEVFFVDLGRSIRNTTRQLTGAVSGRTAQESKAHTRLVLKVLKSSVAPTIVQPGDQVRVLLQYSISGASKQGVQLQEKSSLVKDGAVLSVLKDETVTRGNGSWENSLTFAVPHSAQSGTYTVKLRIGSQGLSRSVQRSFKVQ